ncbi:hypothetical protein CYMTET_36114, partial [Cymbomonas tetramitiformis]
SILRSETELLETAATSLGIGAALDSPVPDESPLLGGVWRRDRAERARDARKDPSKGSLAARVSEADAPESPSAAPLLPVDASTRSPILGRLLDFPPSTPRSRPKPRKAQPKPSTPRLPPEMDLQARQQAALRTLTMSKETREQGTSPIPQLRQAEEPAERLIKLTPHLTPESRTPKPELTPMEVFPAPSPALDLRSVEVFKAELDTVRRQVVGMGVELEAARAEAAQARRAEKTALAAVAGAPAEAWAMASQVEGARREAAEARQAEAGAWQKEARAQLAAEARARELTHEMEALRGALEEARHGEAMAQEEVKALYDVHRGLEVTRAELENTQMAEAHLREEVESLQGCREELERVRVVAANRESAAQAGSDVVRELADELNKARVEVAEVRAEEVTTRAAAEAARVEVGQAWAEAETAKVHTVKEAKQVVAEAVMRAEAQVKEAARGKRAAEKAAAAAREEVAQVAGAARAEVQEARAEQRVSLQASEAAQATLASEFQSARAQTAKLRAELEGEAHAERLRMEAELERAKANAEHWKTEIETEIVREGHHVETELARVRAEHGLAQEAVTIQLLHVQDRANSLLVELEGSRVQLVLREEELSESQRERVSQAAQ